MAEVDGRTWIEYISPEECWERLYGAGVGRIGVLVDSAPEIYPVNFVVDGETIVFRTDPGSKLHGLDRSPSVCFEADGFDRDARCGWSVLVKGRAAEVVAPEDRRAVEALPLQLWSPGAKARWIRIHPIEVTGRRIHAPGAPAKEAACD